MVKKMAWYWIVLIVVAALFGLLFLAYMTNADMKLIEKLYDALIKYHDSKTVEEKSDISRHKARFRVNRKRALCRFCLCYPSPSVIQ